MMKAREREVDEIRLGIASGPRNFGKSSVPKSRSGFRGHVAEIIDSRLMEGRGEIAL